MNKDGARRPDGSNPRLSSQPGSNADSSAPPRSTIMVVHVFVHLLLISVLVGLAVPGINESHYIPKAKHAWDAEFAPGDLFLESNDSHFAATTAAGFLTRWLPMPAVAMIGRIASWLLFSIAWLRLSRVMGIHALFSAFALATWYLGIVYGNWAGEWAIGGFEAKALSYPFVLLALANYLEGNWKRTWIHLGIAVAWHPVVGGWAGLTLGGLWLYEVARGREAWRPQIVPLAIAAGISLIGVLPALSGLGGIDRDGNVVASQVHVFYRLGHHMSPRMFATERHWAAVGMMVALIATTLSTTRTSPSLRKGRTESRILTVAWCSVLIAAIGLLIDTFVSVYQPATASKLLRFYWFRWFDVAIPLAVSLVVWKTLSSLTVRDTADRNTADRRNRTVAGHDWIVAIGVIAVLLGVGFRFARHWQNDTPEADRLMAEYQGPVDIETDRLVDWIAVCSWIRENTPSDSLWLTPRHQQTFKWYAQRAEVVCWKDVPQDNAAVLEWYRREQACRLPRENGKVRGWTTEEILKLSATYEFEWVLVDRSIQSKPPLLEIAYPIDVENRSFAVMRMPR